MLEAWAIVLSLDRTETGPVFLRLFDLSHAAAAFLMNSLRNSRPASQVMTSGGPNVHLFFGRADANKTCLHQVMQGSI